MIVVPSCPVCGAESPDGFKFCGHCGAQLLAAPIPEERKVVTTLFCDLVDSTAIGEAADPEDVDRLLRQYNALARRIVESFGGTVEKFVGDAVVAVFGVPAVHEDDAERAVRAGLRLVVGVEDLPQILGRSIQVRIGVNTGEALVRLDVTPGSGEGFLTGDAVNTAARLQGCAPPMGVVVGETTRDLTVRCIEYAELDPVVVKGKTAPVRLWRALAPLARTGTQTVRDGGTPFVGEAGIGKSRLVTELFRATDAGSRLVTWRQGRCLPFGEGITFSALAEIVKAHAGIRDTDSRDAVESKLDGVLPVGDDREWLRQRLRALLGLETSQAERDENFAAWLLFFEHLARSGPVVLVFEDLHWADGPLLAFLEHLAANLGEVPLLALGTARPELFLDAPDFAASPELMTRIDLARLTEEETEQLITGLVEHAGAVTQLAATIAQRSEGNPFCAEESVRLILDRVEAGGTVGRREDAVSLSEGLAMLPGSIQAILAARLDTLPGELKAVLADAAVIGASFWDGAVAAVGVRDRTVVARALDDLVGRQLVRRMRVSSMEGEEELCFWHGLARDVAYQQLPRAKRGKKHVAAAAWLEAKAGERADDQAEVLAHHLTAALDLAHAHEDAEEDAELSGRAGHYLGLAAERTLLLDLDAARRYSDRALELLPPEGLERGRALHLQAKALVLSGEPAAGKRVYREAAESLRRGGDGNGAAACLIELSMWQATTGELNWQNTREEALPLFDFDHPSVDLVQALQDSAAELTMRLKDHAAGERSAEQALAVAERIGMRPPMQAFEWRSEARAGLGDPRWLADYERALVEGEAQGAGADMSRLRHNYSHVLESTVGPSAALRALRDNIDASKRRGSDFWVLVGLCGVVCELFALGEWDDARDELEEVMPQLVEEGWGEEIAILRSVQALLLAARGEATEAAETDELVAWLPKIAKPGASDHLLSVTCLVAAAALRQAGGEGAEVSRLLRDCVEGDYIRPWGPACEGYRAGVLPWAVRLAAGAQDGQLAGRLAEALRPLTPLDELATVYVRGLVAELQGDREAAAADFAHAAAGWHRFRVPYEEAQALLGRGRCLVTLGRAPEAARPLTAARKILARLGARPALVEAEQLLTQTAPPLSSRSG